MLRQAQHKSLFRGALAKASISRYIKKAIRKHRMSLSEVKNDKVRNLMPQKLLVNLPEAP